MRATEEQQRVIDSHSGNILVKACPGSGKTSALVKRCQALPNNETKLVLAFNKNAQLAFQDRMGLVSMTEVRTFHSWCLREVMRQPKLFGFSKKPTLDADASLFVHIKTANEMDGDSWDELDLDDELIRHMEVSCYDAELKLERPLISFKEIASNRDKIIALEYEGKFEDAQKMMKENEAATAKWRDFKSTMALKNMRKWQMARGILTFGAMVRLVAQACLGGARFFPGDHLMVDEFQDVDRFQFQIISSMGQNTKVKSFCCVGDPNQRIYEWRGALTDAFETFCHTFENVEVFPLTRNFRSSDEIIAFAETVCRVGMNGVRGRMGKVEFFLEDKSTDLIGPLLADKRHQDCAILCRYNRDASFWQIRLARKGIPVNLLGKGNFFKEKQVKLAMKARDDGELLQGLLQSKPWQRFISGKKYRGNKELIQEMEQDATFVHALTDDDLEILQGSMQRKDGIVISTIHKTKGMEWDRVMVYGVGEQLMNDTYVFYVAVTRPKERLVLA